MKKAAQLLKCNKTAVKWSIEKFGVWKGYLAGCRVHPFHINDGWHLGVYYEFTSVADFEQACKNQLESPYRIPSHGQYLHYYTIKPEAGVAHA